ncbi:MAG TPA: hypothetical protein VF622_11765 [Segetibacter sp.]|jgi:hypothetical protein
MENQIEEAAKDILKWIPFENHRDFDEPVYGKSKVLEAMYQFLQKQGERNEVTELNLREAIEIIQGLVDSSKEHIASNRQMDAYEDAVSFLKESETQAERVSDLQSLAHKHAIEAIPDETDQRYFLAKSMFILGYWLSDKANDSRTDDERWCDFHNDERVSDKGKEDKIEKAIEWVDNRKDNSDPSDYTILHDFKQYLQSLQSSANESKTC